MRVVNPFCCHGNKLTATIKTVFTSPPRIAVAPALLNIN